MEEFELSLAEKVLLMIIFELMFLVPGLILVMDLYIFTHVYPNPLLLLFSYFGLMTVFYYYFKIVAIPLIFSYFGGDEA